MPSKTALAMLASAAIFQAASANPVDNYLLPYLLEKRDANGDGLLRMTLGPSPHSESARSMLKIGKALTSQADFDLFVEGNFMSAAASTSNTSTLASDSVTQQLTLMKTVVTSYTSPLQVGTPTQTLNVLFDTGSFNLWIRGKSCNSEACVGATAFDSSASSTFKSSNQRARDLQYADGTVVSGIVASDVVGVGTAKVSNFQFTLADQIVTDAPESEKDSDGIVGMSLTPGDSRLGAYPIFFESLLQAKAITIPQFSYYITPGDVEGQIVFGGYDTSLMADPSTPPTWVSIVDSSYIDTINNLAFTAIGAWALPITGITSPTQGISFSFTGKAGVIFDTGTSLGVIPATLLRRLAGLMRARTDGGGNYIVPCSARNVTGGPVLMFNVGNGVSISLTAEEYVVPVPFKTSNGSIVDLCVLGFQDVPDSQNYVLLGNTLLKRYLTIFDFQTSNIGFALAKGRQPLANGTASITGAGSGNPQPPPKSAASRQISAVRGVSGAAVVVFLVVIGSLI
ncbi:Vacuolar protease A [Dinochytrium kinnereticum]|nr:Vacuolar protease A [Dinochytrium kinnereticum]